MNPRVEELAREAADVLRAHLPTGTRVWWFGSWVKGEAVERSDIDLAVDAGRPLEIDERTRAVEGVEEIATLYKFDIVDLRSIDENRRASLLDKAIEL